MEAKAKRIANKEINFGVHGAGRELSEQELSEATGGLIQAINPVTKLGTTNHVRCPICGYLYDYDTFYHCPNCVKMRNKRIGR